MLFNLCAYWNETRGTVFKKQQFITVCCSTCGHIEMKQRGAVFKKQQFITVCYSTCVHSEMKQEGKFSKKHQFITVCCSTCVHIEMKQDGHYSKKIIITVCYSTHVHGSVVGWRAEGPSDFSTPRLGGVLSRCSVCGFLHIEIKQEAVFKKIQLMTIFYWTHVRHEGAVFKKHQFITVCYSTYVRIEMKQEGKFSKKTTIYYRM